MTSPADGQVPVPASTGRGRDPIDASRPHPARRYDYWLGGKDNFTVDRASADQIAAAFPAIRTAAVENRRFLRRVVTHLAAEEGVRQFLDIGSGFPTSPNVHEIAQGVDRAARVLYVDNDPMVVAHARALMTSTPPGASAYIEADLRDPAAILADPALTATLDLARPVTLLLVAVLHFLDDSDDPYRVVRHLVDALPPGSYVVISHATFDPLPADVLAQVTRLATRPGHGTFRPRSRGEVARFFTGLDLLEPGLGSTVQWQPDRHPRPGADPASAIAHAAVARKQTNTGEAPREELPR